MASYGLIYTAQWQNTREHVYGLRIYRRDYTGSAKEIATLAGCVLEIQGAQGRVIDPIVKTQLRFSVVDAWDIPDTGNTKHGAWDEFFTPDATLYKVELTEVSGNTQTPIWTGYVTPDSWQENLDYHGIITITARDNIGHLKDFTFEADSSITPDEYGLVEVRNLFSQAMQVIEFPMDYAVEATGPGQYSADVPCTENDEYLTEALVNVALFDGMNWYDVLEQALDAIGYTLRYTGGNKFVFACLRNLPKLGNYTSAVGTQTLEFYGGTLELDPAVKKIVEDADYKMESELQEDVNAGLQFTGSKRQYTWQYGQRTDPAWDYQIQNQGGNGWQSGYGFLRGSDYTLTAKLEANEGEDAATAWPLLIANQATPTTFQTFRLPIVSPNVTLHIVFGTPLEGKGLTMQILELGISKTYLERLALRIMYVAGGTTLYWDGNDWDTASHILEYTPADSLSNEYPVDITLGEAEPGSGSYLLIEFRDIQFGAGDAPDQGIYARIKEIGTEIASAVLEKDTVTTINDQAYNVMFDRRPLFSALSKKMGFAKTQNYLAGLFLYPSVGTYPRLFPYQVRFTDQGQTVPLPVLIHQQILCYYHGAARVLNGNCAPVNKARYDFRKIAVYKGHDYLFQGGTLDLFSGIISGAVFREYARFEDIWGDGGGTVESTLTVTPSSVNLTNSATATLQITCNTSWRVKTISSGLSVNLSSGTGSRVITIGRDSSFSGGTVVFETTDHTKTATVNVVRESSTGEITLVSTGADLESMGFPLISGIYYIEINFDTSQDDYLFVTFPNWIHFDDEDLEAGFCYVPGVYGIYCDELPSSTPREGDITADGANTGNSASIHVQQTE